MASAKCVMIAGLLAIIAIASFPPRRSAQHDWAVERVWLFSDRIGWHSTDGMPGGSESIHMRAEIDWQRFSLEFISALAVIAIGGVMAIPLASKRLPG